MTNANKHRVLRRAGFFVLGIAVLCLILSGSSMFYLYWTGFPRTELLPQPLMATLFGVPIYGALGALLIGLSGRFA